MANRSAFASAAIALAASGPLAAADVYPIDFFPDLPQNNGISQLVFVPGFVRPDLVRGTVTQTSLHITFTTGTLFGGGDFDAAGLTLLLTAAVPDAPLGYWLISGADLGWSGHGAFTADISTGDLNGHVAPGVWTFDLSGPIDPDNGPTPYAGAFSDDTRVDVTYTPACVADINQDGDVSVQDIFDFLSLYFAEDAAADVNRQDGVTVQDIFDYLALYFAGCNS